MPRFAIAVTDEDSDLKLDIVEAPDWQVALIECQASPYTSVGPAPVQPGINDFDDEGEYEDALSNWQDLMSDQVFLPESVNGLVDDDFDHGHVVRIVEIPAE